MLESFFFITLGISCILLLMLIYHFKQRLGKLEQNNETMFEILNNIVQELTEMKRYSVNNNSSLHSSYGQEKINVDLDGEYDDIPDLSTIDDSNVVNPSLTNQNERSLDEVESDDDDYQSDSSGTESDEDDESTLSKDENDEEETQEEGVKTVSVEIDNSLDEITENEDFTNDGQEQSDNDNLEQVNLNTEEVDSIKVNKLEEVNNLEENDSNDSDSTNKEIYKKMTVPSLKALVIEKGLTTETSKLKKNDLIELLESNA